MTAPWVDLHNHLIPGVDDGARAPDEAALGVAAMREEGVRRIVATPHFDGSLTRDPAALERRLEALDRGFAALRDVVASEAAGDGMTVGRGVELRLDVPEVDVSDERLRLDGSRTVLVEFPFFSVPPRSGHVLSALHRAGYLPLVAHPERYGGLDPQLDVVRSWLDAGASLQVNAPSLLGRYGGLAREVALRLLERGWVACLSSDYHCRHDPGVAAARALLEERGGEEQATFLFHENADRLLRGEAPLPVPPLTRPSRLRRLVRKLVPRG